MTILGIDPGTNRIGYGIIKQSGGGFIVISSDVIKIKNSQNQLSDIEKGIGKILNDFKPDIIGVEKIYFSKNKKTALSVAQARGVIINSCFRYTANVFEISPAEAKISVTGHGNASKKEVAKMVGLLTGRKKERGELDDETDALAIAIATASKKKAGF